MPAGDQRGSPADAAGRRVGLVGELLVGNHAGDEALFVGFARRQDAALEQDFLHHGGADKLEQALHFTRIHREAEAVDWGAEAGSFAADAKITGAGDLQSAADAGSADQGDRRVRACGNGFERRGDLPVVMQCLVERGPPGDEFLEVAAGGEGCIAGSTHDDAAHPGVAREFAREPRQFAPHGEIDGVQFVRVVQRQRGDFALARQVDRTHADVLGSSGMYRSIIGLVDPDQVATEK